MSGIPVPAPFRLAAFLLVALAPLTAAAEFVGHGGPVKGIALSADGREMVTASFDTSVIRWSLVSGAALAVLHGHEAAVNAVALLPDGGFVTGGDDGALSLWSRNGLAPAARLVGHAGRIASVAVSPDGGMFASGAWDRTVRLWDLATLRAVATLDAQANINALRFSQDGKNLYAVGGDGALRVYRTADGVETARLAAGPAALNGVAALPDGRVVTAGADGKVRLWNIAEGREVASFDAPTPVPLLAVAVGGERLAATGIDGAVTVFHLGSGRLLHRFGGDRGAVWSVAFSPDGQRLFSGGNDRMIRQWNLETGLEVEAPVAVRAVPPDPGTVGDDPGAKAWRRCAACHTLSADGGNRAGPTLHRIFGRKIGTVAGYPYSPALKSGSIVWTPETVADLFTRGPDVVTPGTKMPVQRITDPDEMAALLDFLGKNSR